MKKWFQKILGNKSKKFKVLAQQGDTCKRMKLYPFLTAHIKINSKLHIYMIMWNYEVKKMQK